MSRSLYVVLLLLSLIWGGSYFFIKILLHDFGPWTIAFFRSALGLAAIVILMFALKQPFRLRQIPWLPMAVMAVVNTAIPWAVIGFSETRITSSMASVLNATTPLWTIVLGVLFFRATAHRLQWLGMGAAIIGLMILLGLNTDSFISVDPVGFISMIVASLFYAMGSQLSKRLKGLTMYQVAFGTLLCCMLASGGMAGVTESIPWTQLASTSNIAALISLGVFGSGIAYVLFYFLVQKGSPEFATMVTYLIPVSAMIWGYTMLGEKLHWSLLTGLACILGGILLAGRKKTENAPLGKRQTVGR
ncbi:EamA family transporter [Paenibacillus filicis]|uniref:EamA family transporter n=1 Tax=Paenibacillus gyeongsangnamensis TaxID=3388067 RepID=A0ABT4QHS7_9BACL|nr:EamA family transporter [Paenibacillus filicis]MCZ8516407.1 EamA family transporter [Paenibacillus filicis]